MPNRIIKESICTSDEINTLTDAEECFFYRLLTACDDFGLMDARPAILKARCYPLKSVDINCIQEMLSVLHKSGLIRLYEVEGKPYLQFVTWEKHQQIRAKKPKFPLPEDGHEITCDQLISDVPVIQSNPIQSNPMRDRIGDNKGRAKSLPTDFKPKESHGALATDLGVDLITEFPHFVDHHKGKGTTMKDWDAALNTWLRNAAKFSKGAKRNGIHDKRAETIAALTGGGAIAGTAVRVD